MSDSFIAVVIIAMIMLVFWRITLLALAAITLAMLATGLGQVSQAVGDKANPAPVTAPAPNSQLADPLLPQPPG